MEIPRIFVAPAPVTTSKNYENNLRDKSERAQKLDDRAGVVLLNSFLHNGKAQERRSCSSRRH